MRVSSTFDVNLIFCDDLSSEAIQLGIILYPTDIFHEKFLLKMRECSLKLKDDHPVKVWLDYISKAKKQGEADQKVMTFLSDIFNSKFNLITDVSVKNRIIEVLTSIKGETLGEEILRSYLYLMIGNVARSDNILREIVNRPPYINWQGYTHSSSIYHQITRNNLPQILAKLAKHPSDRKSFVLFAHYLKEFFNDNLLIQQLANFDDESLEGKWSYRAVSRLAPDLSQYVRLTHLEESKRSMRIKKGGFSEEFQLYWVWYFFNIDGLINESFLAPLSRLQEADKLWFYYLMENERLSDLYIQKKGKLSLSQTRANLRSLFKERKLFMLSLFQLIEMGDIDSSLVKETLDFMTHD